MMYYPEPTVRPCATFDPNADAAVLRAAMKGFGTDEEKIINIVANRANFQRQAIINAFASQFGRDLLKDLKSELSGKLEDVVLGLMMKPEEYICKQLNKAMVGMGTDEEALIEILCSRTGEEMRVITKKYDEMYNKSLANHVGTETSGDFRELLTRICSNERANSGHVNGAQAKADAQRLYEAGEKKLGTDEAVFTKLFAQSSFEHLRLVFEEYKAVSGNTIEQALKHEMSGDLKKALGTIVEVAQSPPTYFARKLFKAMDGMGTDDKTLMRILISRCEFDLGNIKKEYEKLYNKTLLSAVKSDTSGDYKKILCALVGSA
ncbi:annexin B10-like [Culicoides brevitarsis]|uniref:annexin B10-like n=1 Tax=Culicoides brevitarsis TaxID=469753 RepID=UPI00307C6553